MPGRTLVEGRRRSRQKGLKGAVRGAGEKSGPWDTLEAKGRPSWHGRGNWVRCCWRQGSQRLSVSVGGVEVLSLSLERQGRGGVRAGVVGDRGTAG